MSQNFIACDRDQAMLMPPSLLDWVPAGHLVWTILASVEEMDLDAFYGAYRRDGHGRPAFDPAMMVALLLYAYSRGNRSSRGIERECQEDVAFMVICAQRAPDHSTIAEFRRRHETALAELFTGVLTLCGEAGLVTVGVIAVDGTKISANAEAQHGRCPLCGDTLLPVDYPPQSPREWEHWLATTRTTIIKVAAREDGTSDELKSRLIHLGFRTF